ncbi:MAG: TolC family protein [Betaproteobacteria bacterium]|nr:TolC family protein [Betaproteobacteria bacterium]
MFKRYFSILACLLFGILPSLAAPDPFSLEYGVVAPCPQHGQAQTLDIPLNLADVVDLALCHNPKTRAAWANAKVEAALVGIAQAAYLPYLDATISGSRQRTRAEYESPLTNTTHSETVRTRSQSADIYLSYLLFDFGGRAANLESQRQLLNAAIAQQDTTRQAVFLEAVQAFYQVHASAAAVEAAKTSETAAQKSLSAAESRLKAGVATSVDKLQAQTAFSQAELNLIRMEGMWRNAEGILANTLGLGANHPVRLEPDELLFSDTLADKIALVENISTRLDAWMEAAKHERPDLRAAEAYYQAARAAVGVARSQGLPTLRFIASPGYQRRDGLDSHSGSVGLTLNIPLFSGFADSYRIRAAEVREEASAIELERLEQQTSLEVWQAWQELRTATQSLLATTTLFASAEAAERMTLGRYQAGVGNILDLLNAQSALADARLQRINAAYDWHISRAALARAIGRLDRRLLDESFFFTEP